MLLGVSLALTQFGMRSGGADPGIAAPFASVNGPTQGPSAGPYNGWTAEYASTPSISSPVAYTADRDGFDATGAATTVRDTFYVTSRVQQPYPNQASMEPLTVALSDWHYATDTITGGATNNSNVTSPKPICNWVTLARGVVGNTISTDDDPIEIVVFHRNARAGRQVACVVFRVTDGTTTITTSAIATTTVSSRSSDRHSCIIVRMPQTTISTLNDNAVITVNAKVYPWVGVNGSIHDSADNSAGREFSPRYFLRNTTLAASPYYAVLAAVEDAGDGVGVPSTSGVVSQTLATAKATPFSTWTSMMDGIETALGGSTGVDGVICYVDDGTFAITAPTNNMTQKAGRITVQRLPTSTNRASVVLTCGATVQAAKLGIGGTFTAPVATGCIRFKDITLQRSGAQAFYSGNATYNLEIQLEDVSFDRNTQTNTWLSNSHSYQVGVTYTSAGNNGLSASTGEHRLLRGIDVDLNSSGCECWLLVASTVRRAGTGGLSTGSVRSMSGAIIAYNDVRSPAGTTTLVTGSVADYTGVAIVQNLWEWTTASAGHCLGISNDSSTLDNTHVVIHHNTFVGYFDRGRVNLFYDEGATPRTSWLHSNVGNIYVQINTKGHVFVTDGTRLGNFAYTYGVGCRDEWSQYIDANTGGLGGSFAQVYPGVGSSLGTSSTVPQMANNRFTDYQAATWSGSGTNANAGAGSGTYTLTSAAECKGTVDTAVLSHTLDGVARATTNDNPGAFSAAA